MSGGLVTRRSLIRSLGALLAAPAIVRASSLMPVRALALPDPKELMHLLEECMEQAMHQTVEAIAARLYGTDAFGNLVVEDIPVKEFYRPETLWGPVRLVGQIVADPNG